MDLPLAYRFAPDRVAHTWVEVYLDERWIVLEGVIMDRSYFLVARRLLLESELYERHASPEMTGWAEKSCNLVQANQRGGVLMKAEIEYLFLEWRNRLGIPFKPENELDKLDIRRGQTILDYGCGIGSFTVPAARLVGREGQVYALDKEPLAVRRVRGKAWREGLGNIKTILSERDTGLLDGSVDVILFYGVLPEVKDKKALLQELHRVLNPDGYLSTRYCFRMKKERLLGIIASTGLFSLKEQKGHILDFGKK